MPESLYLLALLACPLVMGAMMWMMMRGNKQPPPTPNPTPNTATKQAELAGLQAQIDQLQAQRDHERSNTATEPRP